MGMMEGVTSDTGKMTFVMGLGEIVQILSDRFMHLDLNNEQAYMVALFFAPFVLAVYHRAGVNPVGGDAPPPPVPPVSAVAPPSPPAPPSAPIGGRPS